MSGTIFVYFLKKVDNTCFLRRENTLWKGTMTKHCNPGKKLLEIPQDCTVGQNFIWGFHCFVSPHFIEGDSNNLWYVYNAFMKMDIKWHNLD